LLAHLTARSGTAPYNLIARHFFIQTFITES
jgi:hypothetical protein